MAKIFITVHESGGKFYAVRHVEEATVQEMFSNPIFTKSEDIPSGGSMEALEKKVKQEARRRTIAHVINLD